MGTKKDVHGQEAGAAEASRVQSWEFSKLTSPRIQRILKVKELKPSSLKLLPC